MTKIRPTIKLTKAQAKDVYWVIEDKLARLESDLMYGKILTQDRKRSKVVKWLSNRDKELLAERERLGSIRNTSAVSISHLILNTSRSISGGENERN